MCRSISWLDKTATCPGVWASNSLTPLPFADSSSTRFTVPFFASPCTVMWSRLLRVHTTRFGISPFDGPINRAESALPCTLVSVCKARDTMGAVPTGGTRRNRRTPLTPSATASTSSEEMLSVCGKASSYSNGVLLGWCVEHSCCYVL